MYFIVRADGDDHTLIDLVTEDLKKALSRKDVLIAKEYNFGIEAWDNEVKIGDVFWDHDFDCYGGSIALLDMIQDIPR